MKNNYSIPNPCSEDWNTMTPDDNGRFCGSCQKVVIDFTTYSTHEILAHAGVEGLPEQGVKAIM